MKELIAIILLLMIFTTAKGETPHYFNTDVRDAQQAAYAQAKEETNMAKAYVVGVDIRQGLYTITADENSEGSVIITNWDGTIDYKREIGPDWIDTKYLYNEQTLWLPAGCEAVFNISFQTSEYDTGTRQMQISIPGVYRTGKELQPGLYIVQNTSLEAATVQIQEENDETHKSWELQPDAWYTIWLQDGWTVEITEGCLLRSMTTHYIFQEGVSATVPGSRYLTGMQIPGRVYTIKGRDYTSRISILDLTTGTETNMKLAAGECYQLDASGEMLVEMINVDVSWDAGLG